MRPGRVERRAQGVQSNGSVRRLFWMLHSREKYGCLNKSAGKNISVNVQLYIYTCIRHIKALLCVCVPVYNYCVDIRNMRTCDDHWLWIKHIISTCILSIYILICSPLIPQISAEGDCLQFPCLGVESQDTLSCSEAVAGADFKPANCFRMFSGRETAQVRSLCGCCWPSIPR